MPGAGPGTWLLAWWAGALLRTGHVNEIQLCKGGGSGRTRKASVGRGQSECQGPGVEGPGTAGVEHPEAKALRSASWGRPCGPQARPGGQGTGGGRCAGGTLPPGAVSPPALCEFAPRGNCFFV